MTREAIRNLKVWAAVMAGLALLCLGLLLLPALVSARTSSPLLPPDLTDPANDPIPAPLQASGGIHPLLLGEDYLPAGAGARIGRGALQSVALAVEGDSLVVGASSGLTVYN
jgi:hypothetical protein